MMTMISLPLGALIGAAAACFALGVLWYRFIWSPRERPPAPLDLPSAARAADPGNSTDGRGGPGPVVIK